MLLLVVLYLFFLSLSAMFSGYEAGFLSLNRRQYEVDVEKLSGAKQIRKYVVQIDYLLMLILFGNNLTEIVLTNVSQAFGRRIFPDQYTLSLELLVNTATVVIIFSFGEVFPKFIFRTYGNQLLYKTSLFLRIADFIFYPIVFLLQKITSRLSSFLGNPDQRTRLSREDLVHILYDSRSTGLIDRNEAYLLRTFSHISETKVSEVMVPIADLTLIEKNEKVEDYIELFRKKHLSDMFVYDKRIDNIIGYISAKEMFNLMGKPLKLAKDFLITTQYIPYLNTLDDVYNRFSNTDKTAFVVVDEYGGCCGVVSQRDLVERLFGYRYKNKKLEKNNALAKQVTLYKYEVDTSFDIDDFNSIFGCDIKKNGFETLAGFLYFRFGYIPKEGYVAEYEGMRFLVLESTEKSVDRVLVEFSKEIYPLEKKEIQFFQSTEEKR